MVYRNIFLFHHQVQYIFIIYTYLICLVFFLFFFFLLFCAIATSKQHCTAPHCTAFEYLTSLCPLRSLIGLATREYATRRTLVSSRRKQTSTQLKQRWMLPMCRRRLARLTLQQHPTQVPRVPCHPPTKPSAFINTHHFLCTLVFLNTT